MTLKSSLSDNVARAGGIGIFSLTAKLIKRNIWLPILAAIGFLLNMPVAVALVWSNMSRHSSYRYVEGYANDMQMLFNYGSALIVAVGAILAAFVLFKYLHNRRQVDFYHSLPIRREKYYAANMLAGLLVFLVPYALAHILAMPLLAGSGMLAYMDAGNYLLSMVIHILAYMVMFSLAALAMLLSGNFGGASKILLSIYALCPIISGICTLLGSLFLTDYAEWGTAELVLLRLSVIERYFVIMFSEMQISVFWQDWFFGLAILAAAVVAGLLLYKRRNSECAGATLAFAWQKPIFKYPYVMLAGVLGSVVMYAAGDNSYIWLAFGLLFFTLFASQAMEIAIERDFKAFRKNLKGALLAVVAVAVIIGGYSFDVFGYAKWTPTADKVAGIDIYAHALDGFRHSGNYDWGLDGSTDKNDDTYYKFEPFSYYGYANAVHISDPTALAVMIDILNSEPKYYGYNADEWGDAYYDYIDSNYTRVGFKMNNGSYKVRYMDYGGVLSNLDSYIVLYDSDEVRAQMVGSLEIPDELTLQFDSLADYTVVDGYDRQPTYEVPSDKVAAFWQVYRSEFAELSAEQLIKEVPLGAISIQIFRDYHKEPNGNGDYFYDWSKSWYNSGASIYPEMTKTIELIRTYFGDDCLTGAKSTENLVSIVEYTPKHGELQLAPDDAEPLEKFDGYYYEYSGSSFPSAPATEEVIYTDFGTVTTFVDTSLVVADNDDYIGKKVDLSRAKEILAATVTENQLGAVDYYNAWRRSDCLTYYEFKYYLNGEYYVTQTRYNLPQALR